MNNFNNNIEYTVSAVAGSTNIEPETNIYYFTATAAIVYTYNLPVITCDGTRFRIYRYDTLNAATLTISATNNINFGGDNVSSFNLDISSTVTLVSFQSNWYVVRIGRQGYMIPRVLFSGNYTTNTTTYKVLSGVINSAVQIGIFTIYNTNVLADYFSGGNFIVNYISGPPTTSINISVYRSNDLALVASTGDTLITGETVLSLGTVNYSNMFTLFPLGFIISYVMQGDLTSAIGLTSFIIYSKEWP